LKCSSTYKFVRTFHKPFGKEINISLKSFQVMPLPKEDFVKNFLKKDRKLILDDVHHKLVRDMLNLMPR